MCIANIRLYLGSLVIANLALAAIVLTNAGRVTIAGVALGVLLSYWVQNAASVEAYWKLLRAARKDADRQAEFVQYWMGVRPD